jgi:hypothetical protein
VDVLLLGVAEREIPLQAPAGQMSRREGSAYAAGGIAAPPTLVAMRTSGLWAALDSAAYRDEARKVSIADVGGRLGSFVRRLMDSVVAPYLRVLPLERLVDTNDECSPEKTLIEPMTGSSCSRRWG